ncbi:hypothetical protein L3Q82_015320, partial [Scortum barcoo]
MILGQSDLDVEQWQCLLEKDMETFKKETALNCLSVEELEKAELEIIKFCQKMRFPEEFSRLQKGKGVKGHSHIYTLCPLMDDGVLRVGGRLSKSCMPAEDKHPIILAKDSHISVILLRHIHQEGWDMEKPTEILLIKNMTLISVLIWTLLCCCFTESRGQITVTQPGAVRSALGGSVSISCRTSQNVYYDGNHRLA